MDMSNIILYGLQCPYELGILVSDNVQFVISITQEVWKNGIVHLINLEI